MKIAIHNRAGSFSEGWIQYCKLNNIEYKIVNAYDNDIVEQLNDCDAFMWHFHHGDYRDMKFARSLIKSLESKGIKTFPNSNTCWHFDDKIAQKYLLESIGAPLVPSYVFYTKAEAIKWCNNTTFPKVFKLKGGAGASNVKLAHTQREAISLVNKAFGNGFSQYRSWEKFKEAYSKYCNGKATIKDVLRPIKLLFKRYPNDFDHYMGKESGYAYFQDFIPNNTFDIRICVVGNKAFALKRMTRKDDFRASGSGNIVYDVNQIDKRCVEIAFATNKKIKMQSVAFDFVFDKDNNPLIVEISYGFAGSAYQKCEGYWTDDMIWKQGENFDFRGWMVEEIIKQ